MHLIPYEHFDISRRPVFYHTNECDKLEEEKNNQNSDARSKSAVARMRKIPFRCI